MAEAPTSQGPTAQPAPAAAASAPAAVAAASAPVHRHAGAPSSPGGQRRAPRRHVVPGLAVFLAFVAFCTVGRARSVLADRGDEDATQEAGAQDDPLAMAIDPEAAGRVPEPTCLSESCRELMEEQRREREHFERLRTADDGPATDGELADAVMADAEAEADAERDATQGSAAVARPREVPDAIPPPPSPTRAGSAAAAGAPGLPAGGAARVAEALATAHAALARAGRDPGRVLQEVDACRAALARIDHPLAALRAGGARAFAHEADVARSRLLRAAGALHAAARGEIERENEARLADPYSPAETLVGEADALVRGVLASAKALP